MPPALKTFTGHCLLWISSFLSVFATAADTPPNILFILVDDMGWKDLACYGSEFHKTPHIDSLAKRGMRFTNAYAACPICAPSRAAIMTSPRAMAALAWSNTIGVRPGLGQPKAMGLVP